MLRELAQTRAGWAAGSQFVFSQHCKSLRGLGVGEEQDRGRAALAGRRLLRRRSSGWCWPTPTASCSTAAGCPTACSTRCRRTSSDEEILELTYITALYLQHAVMSRALRTEFDDRDEPVVEVAAPDGADVGLDITAPKT